MKLTNSVVVPFLFYSSNYVQLFLLEFIVPLTYILNHDVLSILTYPLLGTLLHSEHFNYDCSCYSLFLCPYLTTFVFVFSHVIIAHYFFISLLHYTLLLVIYKYLAFSRRKKKALLSERTGISVFPSIQN